MINLIKKITLIAVVSSLSFSNVAEAATPYETLKKNLSTSVVRYEKMSLTYSDRAKSDKINAKFYLKASDEYKSLSKTAKSLSTKLTKKNVASIRKQSIKMHKDALKIYKYLQDNVKK